MARLKNPDLSHVPGNLGWPYIGTAFSFFYDALGMIREYQKKYGDVFKSRFFGNNSVYLLGGEANKFLLVEQAKNASSQQAWEGIVAEIFPNGLILMDGDRHKHHRSIVTSAFGKEALQGYLVMTKPIIDKALSGYPTEIPLRMFEHVKTLTLDVAGKVFFGVNFSDDINQVNSAIKHVLKAAMAIPIKLPFTTYGRGVKARKRLNRYFLEMVETKRQSKGKDLFSLLCHAENEQGDRLSDQEIVDHLIFILMASHDTTASALTSMIYLLGKHTHWQIKLRREATLILRDNSDYDLKSLSQLSGLSLAIKETLRMYTPITMVPRVMQKPVEFGGFSFPSGTNFCAVFQHAHRDSRSWKNPCEFDPERFAKLREEHKACPYAYAPFGAGPHHCLGSAFAEMEIKSVMLSLLTKFQWTIDADYQIDTQQVPIQEPRDGLPISLEKVTPS